MAGAGITIVGLGPGDPGQLTRQAWDVLVQAGEVYVRTRQHPVLAGLPAQLVVHSFDALYEQGDTFEAVYAAIIERILELGRRPQGVTYAVPGHPYVAEATGPEIVHRAALAGLPVRVIAGLSFLEPVVTALALDPFPRLALVDAMELSTAHHPHFPPNQPALVAQIYSPLIAAEVKMTLLAVYPDDHPVRLVHAAGTPAETVESLALYEIDRSPKLGLLSTLYVPPLPGGTAFEDFQEIVAHLRAPEGCPWDREQTHTSLRNNLLEECYEALQALDEENQVDMAEEFGDLLLQIVLHAQIASEEGSFRMGDIIRGISSKLVRRHPHVFGDVKVDGVGGVLKNWEILKAEERKANGLEKVKGLLDGVPVALPSLNQAQDIQDRAARVGFDWPEISGVEAKIGEELEEIHTAPTPEARAGEVGDLLFAVVNLARWYKVDAESALRQTNLRFRRRFSFIEKAARQQNRELSSLSFEEMDHLWEAAKDLESE
jgi:tetrapyrrole methylase family protein / MazG family protein